MKDWRSLEHQLWRELHELELVGKKILVGLSGGVDSLALLWSLFRVRPQGVEACFVHHGAGENQEYRDQAYDFCQNYCVKKGIPFHSRRNLDTSLQSESELRVYRYQVFEEVKKQTGAELLALGHHREDLLETRLLRLIRGTGPQGLVAMQVLQQGIFRPFLRNSKKELLEYLKGFGLEGFEDPSNSSTDPLRNWLRREWLVALEGRQQGAVQALARSLEILAESQSGFSDKNEDFQKLIANNGISRPHYLALTKTEQKRALAHFILRQNVQDFTQSHLEEIQKRLDNSQKEFTFKVAGIVWIVNAQQIRVQN